MKHYPQVTSFAWSCLLRSSGYRRHEIDGLAKIFCKALVATSSWDTCDRMDGACNPPWNPWNPWGMCWNFERFPLIRVNCWGWFHIMTRKLTYCWWTKSCTTKDDEYPVISHYLQGFNHPRWCRILSINSIPWKWMKWMALFGYSSYADPWKVAPFRPPPSMGFPTFPSIFGGYFTHILGPKIRYFL